MRKLIIVLIVAAAPILGLSAWLGNALKSNGATPVTIVSSPAADTSRTVPANGGIKICNTSAGSVTCSLFYVDNTITNYLDSKDIILGPGDFYYNDWVCIISTNTGLIRLQTDAVGDDNLDITTHYRDEGQ